MSEYLFKKIDYENDPEWIVKEFFNSMNTGGKFIWMLPYVINKIGCGMEETFCSFPDSSDPDPENHFEGVMFGVWGGETIVSEETALKYIRLACEKYVKNHPKDAEKVKFFLDKISN